MDISSWCEVGIQVHFARPPFLTALLWAGTEGVQAQRAFVVGGTGIPTPVPIPKRKKVSSSKWGFRCAPSASRIPRVRVLEDEEGSKDIELSDDPYDCIRLSVENVPCIITLCKV